MTKSNGCGSKSAQSSLPSTWAKPKKQAFSFLHLNLLEDVSFWATGVLLF
jgi:hypothetical protein